MKTKKPIVRDFDYYHCGPDAIVAAVRAIASHPVSHPKETFVLAVHPNSDIRR